jgi:hypothetical protein
MLLFEHVQVELRALGVDARAFGYFADVGDLDVAVLTDAGSLAERAVRVDLQRRLFARCFLAFLLSSHSFPTLRLLRPRDQVDWNLDLGERLSLNSSDQELGASPYGLYRLDQLLREPSWACAW